MATSAIEYVSKYHFKPPRIIRPLNTWDKQIAMKFGLIVDTNTDFLNL